MPLTKIFAMTGLDGRTIGSKTLIGNSSDVNNKTTNVIFNNKTLINFGISVTEC